MKNQKPKHPEREWVDDPEPGDMDDPIYREEIFEAHRAGGDRPEDFIDPKLGADYKKWLEEKKNIEPLL